jgi:uncharacterized SAM-dependent methyltransferase
VRKVEPLLDAFEKMERPIQYFALDLSLPVLRECMERLQARYRIVHCHGLWGTFDDALKWAKDVHGPKCWMSLGSMFGNDHFDSAVMKLKGWAAAMNAEDRMLLGLDACQDRKVVWKSYHDKQGLFHGFILNGFLKSNEVLGHEWFRESEWQLAGEFQSHPLMHHFNMTALTDVKCEALGISFPKNQRIVCYEGFKYTPGMVLKQLAAAGMTGLEQWKSPSGRICEWPRFDLGLTSYPR